MMRSGLLMGVMLVGLARGATNLLVNEAFELGAEAPTAWRLVGPGGQWQTEDGRRCLTVTGTGEDTGYWRQDVSGLHAGRAYRLSFVARATGAGGCVVAGTGAVNRDFQPGGEWGEHSFVFTPPRTPSGYVRLGQWQRNGTVFFDRVRLTEVAAVHVSHGDITLGTGESLKDAVYAFDPVFDDEGSNLSRPLVEFTCGFNSNRWTLGPGTHIVYRHHVPGRSQTRAQVTVHLGYHVSGSCLVEVGPDGERWQTIGRLDGLGRKSFDVPASLLPAEAVYVRLRASTTQDDEGRLGAGSFQVYGYAYRADLNAPVATMYGATRFVEIEQATNGVEVQVASIGTGDGARGPAVELRVRNRTKDSMRLTGRAWTVPGIRREEADHSSGEPTRFTVGAAETVPIRLAYWAEGTGEHTLHVELRQADRVVYAAQTAISVTPLEDASFGYLGGDGKQVAWWWCEGTYKVGRQRPLPTGAVRPVRIAACRGEYEPVQIVIRPKQALRGLTARIMGDNEALVAATKVHEVAYHYVQRPTDSAGCVGWWPDALPPLDGPIGLEPDMNQPLWVLTKIPKDCPAGDHVLTLTLSAEGVEPMQILITVHVYDFAIPYPGHVTTAFGLSAGNIRRYHNLETLDEQRRVWDAYMASFREHRISPYDFAPFDPIRLEWDRSGPEDAPELRARLDFTAWDAQARRYLDGFGFNSFRLPLAHTGGGTFHSRSAGRIGPYEQGTPGYRAAFADYAGQIERHLEQNHWLDEAYVYWFDEPDPKDYAFVVNGMEEIHRAAPKLRRMLTEEPNPALFGAVDIWCPVLHNHDPEACRARQEAGEEIWWYVCTGPKAPYPGLFIDHNAIDLRIWLWMTWKWNVQGVLIWQSNYWTSPAAFPRGRLQNPWTDPMGYVSGYDEPEGYIGYWGNGDGRFIYPPNRDIENDRGKYLDGPVSSIRWEMLREGLEDFEYFQMLREAIDGARQAGRDPATLERFERLLDIPPEIITDKTHFTLDPRPLYAQRDRIARAIEALGR